MLTGLCQGQMNLALGIQAYIEQTRIVAGQLHRRRSVQAIRQLGGIDDLAGMIQHIQLTLGTEPEGGSLVVGLNLQGQVLVQYCTVVAIVSTHPEYHAF